MGITESIRYRQETVACPQALGRIRRIVTAHACLWGFERESAESVALCVHELLANVPKHTGSPVCTLTLERWPDRLRATVSDSSRALPELREADWARECGRGLVLLRELTDAWGADRTRTGKDVWFELAGPRRLDAVRTQGAGA